MQSILNRARNRATPPSVLVLVAVALAVLPACGAGNTGDVGDSLGVESSNLTGVPAAPSNLLAAGVSASEIDLAWNDNSTNETGFKVERATNHLGPFTQITVTPANATTYADRGLAVSTTYYYRVRATNSSGNSTYSNTAYATTPAWTGQPDTAGGSAYYGYTVASAGDVNGDGYADVAIGAYHYNGAAGKSVGKVYVYLGERAGLSSTPSWSVEGATAQDYLGYSVASAGDVNHDGYADLIVGATEGGKYSGSTGGYALLYLGGPRGLSTTAQSLNKPASSVQFGFSVASAGDVNRDGYADVIVGDIRAGYGTGQASLYLGSKSGLSSSPVWTVVGEQSENNYGCSVASAGDVNGDGYADVLVGAEAYPMGTGGYPIANGKVYLYLGSARGLPTSASWTVVGALTNLALGSAVASAGDINRDGIADFVLGGYNSYGGRVYVFLGVRNGLPAKTPNWDLAAPAGDGDGAFGSSVASGDVNGDGYSDVIVGNSAGDANRGVIHVYRGGSTGLSTVPAWTAVGEVSNPASYLGASSAVADVNHDGYADVVGGANHFNNNAGKAYLFTRVAR
jgi:hypothetical protein